MWPLRTAELARAQPRNVLPAPVGPTMAKLWWALTQPQAARPTTTERSRPLWRWKSMSSMTAPVRNLARANSGPHGGPLIDELFVDQQPEAFFEAQSLVTGLVAFRPGRRPWPATAGVKPVDGLVIEHFVVPFSSCNNRGHAGCHGPGG